MSIMYGVSFQLPFGFACFLLLKVYLKLQCNCLLLSESVGGDGGQPDDEFELGHRTGIETGEDSEGSSGDELWNGMQTVGECNYRTKSYNYI